MHKLERLYRIREIFEGRRTPVSLNQIAEQLECSPATAKRAIRETRTLLNAPVVYDRALGGYRCVPADGERRFELPGLWFREEELAALLTLREVMTRLAPGLLSEALSPLARRLEELLASRKLGLKEASRRIRVLSQHARNPGASFAAVAAAVLSRHQLIFCYARRSDGETSERTVSPQRLTRYRGCWYLDAWCHDREGLRTFALERIAGARALTDRSRNVPESDLDAHYGDAYGIFAGKATEIAVLRVAPHRARWVADELWHPRQSGSLQQDGSYELRVPYGRPEELILDILRLGADAEVIEPLGLRKEVARRLSEASAVYEGRRRTDLGG